MIYKMFQILRGKLLTPFIKYNLNCDAIYK